MQNANKKHNKNFLVRRFQNGFILSNIQELRWKKKRNESSILRNVAMKNFTSSTHNNKHCARQAKLQ